MAIDFTEKYLKLVKAGFPIEKVPEKYREKVKAIISKSGFLKEDEKMQMKKARLNYDKRI